MAIEQLEAARIHKGQTLLDRVEEQLVAIDELQFSLCRLFSQQLLQLFVSYLRSDQRRQNNHLKSNVNFTVELFQFSQG